MKWISAGLSTIGLVGCAIRAGIIFGSYILATARNPSFKWLQL
jgi:F0F1-type ATP synthase membrane subunit c/vacuolar-type H+-ATPase subunit K